MHQRPHSRNAENVDLNAASLSLPLADWIITVAEDPARSSAVVVRSLVDKIGNYLDRHGLHHEVGTINKLESIDIIAIQCSARMEQILEEFPEVLSIERCQDMQLFVE